MNLDRDLFIKLKKAISPNKVILLYWPRRVGKTYIINQLIESFWKNKQIKFVSWENRMVKADLSSENIDKLKSFVWDADILIIDEAQVIKNIWLNLKLIVDHIPWISVIASWSASFDLAQKAWEPLAWRKKTLELFPISVNEIINNFDITYHKSTVDETLIYWWYPELFSIKDKNEKISYLWELVDSFLLKDILAFDSVKNSDKLYDLLKLLAFQIWNEVSINEFSISLGIAKDTVPRY